MKTSYSSIKRNAKAAMKGHMGEVILVSLILPIAFSMIANFVTGIFGMIHWSAPTILSVFTSAITTYITLRMVIKIVRFKPDKIFNNFLGSKKGIFSSMGFVLITLSFGLVYVIIFWQYFELVWRFMEILPADYFVSDPDALEAWVNSQTITEPSSWSLIIAVVYSLFVMIITVRISFTAYIIADSDLKFIDAMKKSWRITRGNWWRIVFFPLSFILWFFAVIFSFGLAIIYVGPYLAISQGALYDALLLESGEEIESSKEDNLSTENITDESALDESKDTFDKEDPFENY